MTTTIVGTIQEIVRQELRRVRVTELGVVEDVYPHSSAADDDNYGCDVRLSHSGLLLRRVPLATGHIGTVAIPNKGDLVLLVFDQGDVNQPIVIGRLYNDIDRPPLNAPDEIVFRQPLAKPDNETIKGRISNHAEAGPPREVLLELPPKIVIQVTDGTVKAAAGRTGMTLDQPDGTGGTVTVVAGRTKITVNQDGDVSVDAAGSISLKAGRDVTIKGQSVSISADRNVDISARVQASVQASMGATVDGGLSATVKGTSVTVSGLTSFSP